MPQSSVSDRIENPTTRKLLREADLELAWWERIDFELLARARELRTVAAEIRRARVEFDAKLFFVVVCGPSKAGKSTLMRSLART